MKTIGFASSGAIGAALFCLSNAVAAPDFGPPATYAIGHGGVVVTADFNRDGALDLAVTNYFRLTVLLGDGHGAFQPFFSAAVPWAYSNQLVAEDVDGDGVIDLIGSSDREVSIMRGAGDGTFSPSANFSAASGPPEFTVGDLNGDGLPDFVIAQTVWGGPEWGDYGFIDVYRNLGAAGFTMVQSIWVGQYPSPHLVDLDGDGVLDLAVGDAGCMYLIAGDGDGRFGAGLGEPYEYWPTDNLFGFAFADFDRDGAIDIASSEMGLYGPNRFRFLMGVGGGEFADAGSILMQSRTPEAADFNGDGVPDLIGAGVGLANVICGFGDGTFGQPFMFALGIQEEPVNFAVGDFNGDGLPDVATASWVYAANGVVVLINDGNWREGGPEPPGASVTDVALVEGNSGVNYAFFDVTLSSPPSQTVTIGYSTSDGTAAAGSDYQAQSGTLTFVAGELKKTVSIPVFGDRTYEQDEVFFLRLTSATGAVIAVGQAAATIINDEPFAAISDVSLKEGKKNQKTTFAFTVHLSAAYDAPVTMSYRTVDGTAKTADGDYVAKSGTLSFAPGQKEKTISVTVNGDVKREPNETFFVELYGPSSNVYLWEWQGVGTIINDD